MQTLPSSVKDFVSQGSDAMRRKDWPEAAKLWALMREKFPEHPRGYVSGAAALKEQGVFSAADALVREGLEKFPQEVWLYNEYGWIAMRQKDWPEAAKRWALMREKFPDNPRGYVGGAVALKESKDFSAADALVLEGMEKFPKEAGLSIEYGDIAMRQRDWSEAVKRWALMREKFPDHPRGYHSGAVALKESQDFAAAEALVLVGMEKFPQEAGLYIEYGDIAVRQRDWPEAVKRWALMREKYPEHPRGYIYGAAALKEQQDFSAADALALEGQEKFPQEAGLYIEYGDIAVRQRDWPEAVKRWALMREKYPEHPRGYIYGAAALKEQQDFSAADALVLEGLEKFPQEVGLYNEYGDIAVRQRDWEEAAKRWALMREKYPEHPRGYQVGVAVLKEKRNFAAADALVLKALEQFPKEPGLYAEYGNIAMRQRNWPEAIKRWALMREKLPEHPRGYVSCATVLKEQRDFASADAFILQALERFPKEPGLYIEYGNIAVRQRDWSEAVKRWALMRENLPEHSRGYVSGAAALKENRDFAAADALALEGLEKFPKEAGLYVEYGHVAMSQRDWSEAIRRWAMVREHFPQSPQGYTCGSAACLEQADWEQAEALAQLGMEQLPTNIQPFLDYAEAAMRQRNFDEALKRWAFVRQRFPKSHQGYTRACAACLELLDWEQAEALARQGMEKMPGDAQSFISFAEIAMQRRDFDEALKRWAVVRAHFPKSHQGYTRAGTACLELSAWNQAETLAQLGMERLPDEPQLFFFYAQISWRQWQFDEALQRCAVANERFPRHAPGYVTKAAILKAQGEYDAADAVLLDGMEAFPGDVLRFWDEYVNVPMAWMGWPETVKRCATMREKFPLEPHGWQTAANALGIMKDFAAMETVACEGVNRFPGHIELRKSYANAAIQQENWREAQSRCASIREKFPYHAHGYLLGVAAFRGMNDYQAAEELLRLGISKCPAEASLYVAHAYLAMCQRNYDEAFERWAVVREKFREFPLADFNIEANKPCKVSTIILSYNHENYISNAIESALRQEGNFEHEIIVSDDGSKDNTRQVIEEYCRKYPNIINISKEENVGNPENYKRCFAAASGDYIAILEGDDLWIDPYKLAMQISVIQNNEDCCLVCTNKYLINEDIFTLTKAGIIKNELFSIIYDSDITLKKFHTDHYSHWLIDARLLKDIPVDDLCFYKNNKKYFLWEHLCVLYLSHTYNKKVLFINDRLFIHLNLDFSTAHSLEDYHSMKGHTDGFRECIIHSPKSNIGFLVSTVDSYQKRLHKFTTYFSIDLGSDSESMKPLPIPPLNSAYYGDENDAEHSELNICYACLANYLMTKNIDESDCVPPPPAYTPLTPYLKYKSKIFDYTSVQISKDISFSIIMPTYNRAYTIQKAINSVLNQTYNNFELIIIDDGSDDCTEELLNNHYAEYLATGKIIYTKIQKSGVSIARNMGLALAKNRYIAYIDSDNFIKDYFLEVFAYAIQLNPDKRNFYCMEYKTYEKNYLSTRFNYHTLVKRNYIDMGTFVHHHSLVDEFGDFDQQLGRLVDYDLILRYTKDEIPFFIPIPLVVYNSTPNDYTRITNNGKDKECYNYIREKYAAYYNVATCILVYNHRKHISQAIESALMQKGIRQTIYIFDDCSDDKTSVICKAYTDEYENIKYIRNQCNLGRERNLEQCFQVHGHDFIAILEGDDYWTDQTKLLQQAAFLLTHRETSMVFSVCRFLKSNDNGTSLELHKDFKILPEVIADGQFISAEHLMYCENLNPVKNLSTAMFRSNIVNHIPQSFYSGSVDETSICFFLLRYGNIGYINTVGSMYRIHKEGFFNSKDKEDQYKYMFESRKHCLSFVSDECKQYLTHNIDELRERIADSFSRTDDCIAWADEPVFSGDWPEAAKRWALMREKFPFCPVRRNYDFYKIFPPEWYPEELKQCLRVQPLPENLAVSSLDMRNLLKIDVYCVCKNEMKLAPFFVDYWYALADEVEVYVFDEFSDDGTREYLGKYDFIHIIDKEPIDESLHIKFKNHAWKRSRGTADFVMVCDFDETIFSYDVETLRSELRNMKNSGYTILYPYSFNILADDFPRYEHGHYLHELCEYGYNDEKWYAKPILFDPDKIAEINYTLGAYTAYPRGEVRWYRSDKLFFIHAEYLGLQYFVEKIRTRKISEAGKRTGHYGQTDKSLDELEQEFHKHDDEKFRWFDIKDHFISFYRTKQDR